MVEYTLCTRTSPHLIETEAIVPCNFSFLVLHYVTSYTYTYICHMLMIYSFTQMSELTCRLAVSHELYMKTRWLKWRHYQCDWLNKRLVTIGGTVNKCLSHHTYRFPEFLLFSLLFLDVNQRVLPDSPNCFIPHWKISYLNLLFPFIFDLCW